MPLIHHPLWYTYQPTILWHLMDFYQKKEVWQAILFPYETVDAFQWIYIDSHDIRVILAVEVFQSQLIQMARFLPGLIPLSVECAWDMFLILEWVKVSNHLSFAAPSTKTCSEAL